MKNLITYPINTRSQLPEKPTMQNSVSLQLYNRFKQTIYAFTLFNV